MVETKILARCVRVSTVIIGITLLVLGTYWIHRTVYGSPRIYPFQSRDFAFWVDAIVTWILVGVGIFGALGLSVADNFWHIIFGSFLCLAAIIGVYIFLNYFQAPRFDRIEPLIQTIILLGMVLLFSGIAGHLFKLLSR